MQLRFPHFLCLLTLASLLACCLSALSVLHTALAQSGFTTAVLRPPADWDAVMDFVSQVPLRKFAYIFLTRSASHIFLLMMLSLNALLLGGWVLQGVLFAWNVSAGEMRAARDHTLNFAVFRLIFLGSILETMGGGDRAHGGGGEATEAHAVAGTVPLAPGAGTLRELACWLAWFGVMGFLRWFLVLLRERFTTAQASPYATVRTFGKYLAITLVFSAVNTLLAAGVLLLCGPHTSWTILSLMLFENVVLMASCIKIVFRYALYIQTLRKEQPWEERGSALYYADQACEISVQCATLVHLLHIWSHYGLSFSLLDLFLFLHVRQLVVGVWRNLKALRTYRRSVWELNARFPDASPAELERLQDDVCSICRDAMEQAKKLPCGHLFHRTCLIQWIEHASFCPTCRAPLLPRAGAVPNAAQQRFAAHPAPVAVVAPVVPNVAQLQRLQEAADGMRHMRRPVHPAAAAAAAAATAAAPLADNARAAGEGVWTSPVSPPNVGLRFRGGIASAAATHAHTGQQQQPQASPSSILGLTPSPSTHAAAAMAAPAGQHTSQADVGSLGADATESQPKAADAASASSSSSSSSASLPDATAASQPTSPMSMRERVFEATQRRLAASSSRDATPSAATSPRNAEATVAPPATEGEAKQQPDAAEAAKDAVTTPAVPVEAVHEASAAAAAAAPAPSASAAAALPSSSSSASAASGSSPDPPVAAGAFHLQPAPRSPPLLSQAEADANLARELQYEEEMLAAEEERRRRNAGGAGVISRFFSGAL